MWEGLWERGLEVRVFSYGVLFLFPPPIGSWESLVDVVAGSSPVGGTRSYCIPNRAGESQFPSVSPPEPTIGLSPRVRGNRSGSAPLSVMTRSIPACAGEPSTSRGRTARSTVYPRVCGGTLRPRWSRRSVVGLSPRVRGNLAAKVVPPFCSGSIPACAGEPPKRCAMSTICRVYPRVCGGTRPRGTERDSHYGLSPRVRGNQGIYNAESSGWNVGLSPRVRGNPPKVDSFAYDIAAVYPRVCGGTAGGRWQDKNRGLSPRVRGTDDLCPQVGFGGLYVHLGVGLSPRVRGNRCQVLGTHHRACLQVYPRVCGGTIGYNPRAGLIPACAGEPLP